ncbi:MAG: hypothetical protein RL410_664 [Actinomycetota bacterium]|jgi:predicted O-methyltransferase YrrM
MAFDATNGNAAPDERGWAFVESLARESESIRQARIRSAELNASYVTAAEGAALRMLAHASSAAHIVEIGTSTGGATQWLVQGLRGDGQVTSIDADGEHHRIAKELFAQAAIATSHTRLITGRPAEVLPRLQDAAYDMVVLATDPSDLNPLLDQAIRLLRVNGLIVLLNALGNGKVGDPAQRDAATIARRLFVQRINNDPRLMSSMLPVGHGLLVASVLNRDALQE